MINISANGAVKFLVLIFPVVALTVKDAGSIILVTLFLISLFYISRARKSVENKELVVLIAFFCLFLVASFSLLETDQISSGLKRLERYFRFAMIVPVYLMLRFLDVDVSKMFITMLVVTSYVIFGQTLYQILIIGLPTAQGAYHQILFGEYAVLLFALLSAVYLFGNEFVLSKNIKIVVVIGAVLSLTSAVLSESKGAWSGIPVLVVLFAIIYREKITGKVFSLALLFLFILSIGLASSPAVQKRMDNMYQDYVSFKHNPRVEGTLSTRINMWRDSWTIFKSSPLIGTGLGDYEEDVTSLMEKGISNQTGGKYSHPHSIYFDVLATTGILGFIAMMLALFILPFRYFYKAWKSCNDTETNLFAFGGMITVVSYAVFGLSETWLAQNAAVNVYIIFIALFLYSVSREKSNINRVT